MRRRGHHRPRQPPAAHRARAPAPAGPGVVVQFELTRQAQELLANLPLVLRLPHRPGRFPGTTVLEIHMEPLESPREDRAGASRKRASCPRAMALLESGKVLGRWTVVRFIDDGGNGEVWEVVDEYGQPAALEVLRDYRADSVPYERFCREISAVQALGERPGVLPILDVHRPISRASAIGPGTSCR